VLQQEITAKWSNSIQVLYGSRCADIVRDGSGKLTVLVSPQQSDRGSSSSYEPPKQLPAQLIVVRLT
jgi:hypothetical protein